MNNTVPAAVSSALTSRGHDKWERVLGDDWTRNLSQFEKDLWCGERALRLCLIEHTIARHERQNSRALKDTEDDLLRDLPYRQLYGNVPLSDPFVAAISTTLGPGGSYGGIFQAFLGLHVRHARSMSATVETLSLWLRELRDPTVDAGESANDKCLIVPSNARIEETSGGESARGNTSRSSSSALDMKQNEQQEAQQPNEIMARCTSRLNEHHAKTGASLKYLEFDVGSPLAPSFHVECHVDDAIFVGAGRNKKEAKHRASKEACARLGI